MFHSDNYKGNKKDTNGYWYLDSNGMRHQRDEKCYVDFCKAVMMYNQSSSNFKGPYDGQLIGVLGENFADLLYQLRCDILHAGVSNIFKDDKGIYLALGELCGSTDFSKYRLISVQDLCNTIFNHVSSYCANNSIDNFKYTYVFDMDNSSDDRILYNRLCIDDRANYLVEEFAKENEQHQELNQ